MKKLQNLLPVILILAVTYPAVTTISGCKTVAPTAEVNFTGAGEKGTVRLRAIGYGNTKEKALHNAEQNAFEVLMFRGIPGSSQENALIANETDAKKKHKTFFDDFFEGKKYRTYMMASAPEGYSRKKGYTKATTNMKININSLRRNLEENNIVRKFGF